MAGHAVLQVGMAAFARPGLAMAFPAVYLCVGPGHAALARNYTKQHTTMEHTIAQTTPAPAPMADAQCERDALGAALTYNQLLDSLSPELFRDPSCSAIFTAARAVRSAGGEADVVGVMAWSAAHQAGISPEALTSLFDRPNPASPFARNLARLRELAARRRMAAVASLARAAATSEVVGLRQAVEAVAEGLRSVDTAAGPAGAEWSVDLAKPCPGPTFLLSQDGVGFMPRGDLQAIKAKSKSGKSLLSAVLAASVLGCAAFGISSCCGQDGVVYFDTEQHPRSTMRLVRRIHAMLGWHTDRNNPRLAAYCLRAMPMAERLPFIRRTVERARPAAVFIDGVADLLADFNEVGQSTALIGELMRLSAGADCAVCCVLHTNKGDGDHGMKGHLGTLLLQKASEVFEVTRRADDFVVEQTDCRNRPVAPFAFSITDSGVIMPVEMGRGQAAAEVRAARLTAVMRESFGPNPELTYGELCEAVAVHAAVSGRTAKRKVTEARAMGILAVDRHTEKYSLKGG